MKSPSPCEQSRRNAEGDNVGKRIELAAKIAGGFGHARDAAIEAVKENREPNSLSGIIKMPGLLNRNRDLHRVRNRVSDRAMNHLQDGVVAQQHIRGSEQRRQNV